MAQIISFGDLFNFDDSTPIDEVIAKIEKLDSVYEKMVANAEKSAASYSDSLNDIAKSAEKLDGEMENLDATLKEHQDLILKSATQAEKLLAAQDEARKSMEAERIAAEKLKAAEDALRLAKEQLANQNLKEAGSVAALRQELNKAVKEAEAMGDATDDLVKKAALDKIEQLAKGVNTAEAAIKQAKKGVDVAKGSYNALSQEVDRAKKELKAMEGGIGSNSARFEQLKKTVKEGTDKLKEFDEGIGDNRRNVGGYQGAIIGAVEKLRLIPGAAGLADKALKVLSSTPVVAILTGIGAAVAALTAYFKGSVEGQDDFNKVMAVGNAIFQTALDVVEYFGKVLFKAITEPKKVLDELLKIIQPVTDALTSLFNDPLAAIKEFGQLILDNIISRIESVGVAFDAVNKLLNGDFAEGFKGLADAAIQGVTGVKNGTDKIVEAVTGAYEAISEAAAKAAAELEKRIALGQKIADLENQIRKEKIADIVDDAKTEVAINDLLVKSKDKLKQSDEQRFASLRQVAKLSQEQLKGDLELIGLEIEAQKLRIQQDGDTYEARQKLAELQVQELKLQADFSKARKKRQTEEIALIREIEKDTQDRINREMDAQRLLNDTITKGRIESNKTIIADERTSLDDRIALLNDNADLAISLTETVRDKELAAAKESALQRVNLDADTLDAIYSNETISINARIAQERAAKEQLIGQDQAYIDTVTRLSEDFKQTVIKINDETVQATADNVFKQWANDYQDLIDGIDEQAATEALGLNEAFEAGKISLKDFQETRKLIQDEANTDALESQLAYLEKQQQALANAGFNTAALERSIAETRLALSDANNAKLIEGETMLQAKLKELKQVGYATALSLIDSFNEAEQIKRDERLAALDTNYQNELMLAGDNDAAKLELENAYKLEKDKLDKEQRAADRKKAIFQKTLAVVEIAINTARGIGMALGTFPPPVSFALAAVTAVIGALQIAAVLAKPIPAFAEGTDDAPGGWALVGEEGPEAVSGRKGTRIHGQRGPEIVKLDPHDKVFTAEETARLREATARGDHLIAGFDDDTQKMRFVKVEVDTDTMTAALGSKLDQINGTLQRTKPPVLHTDRLAREVARGFNMAAFENQEYK